MKRVKIYIHFLNLIFVCNFSCYGSVHLTGDISIQEFQNEDVEKSEGEEFEELVEPEGMDQLPVCGNGIVEPGEQCDTINTAPCITFCNSTGTMICQDCKWSDCTIPSDTCNGVDDDCNGIIDDVSGVVYCGDGCCNGQEDSCTCPGDCGLPPPPSPTFQIVPHNGQRLMTRRPNFRWFSSEGQCGEPEYTIQVDDSCTTPGFSSCDFPNPEINESGLEVLSFLPSIDLPIRSSPPVGKRYYWRVRACYGDSCSPWSAVWYVNIGMAEIDFDGDGYGDLAVGADQEYFGEGRGGGAVYIYYGSEEGFQNNPSTILENPLGWQGVNFGYYMVQCDANGDGYTDLFIKNSPGFMNQSIYFYPGGPMGISSENFRQMQVSGSNLFYAGSGEDISCSGDLNFDGFDDFVIGEPLWNGVFSHEGRVYVYLGDITGPQVEPSVILGNPDPQEGGMFGTELKLIRDLNADGYADLVIGSPLFDNETTNEGIIYVYYGNSSGTESYPSIVIENPDPAETAEFGNDIESSGDINGDGFDDIVVGTWTFNGREEDNKVYVFYGANEGLSESFTRIYSPDGDSDDVYNFGGVIGSACDFNLDGYDDIYIYTTYSGIDSVIIYNGGSAGIATIPYLIIPGPVHDDNDRGGEFGISGGCIGDINRDGNYEIAAGAHLMRVERCNYFISTGKVFIYSSDGHTISPEPSIILENPFCNSLSNFGISLSTR